MNWYRFHAYNTQALYGFGSAEDADKFCDRLNQGRDINHYAAEIVSKPDATATFQFRLGPDKLIEGRLS